MVLAASRRRAEWLNDHNLIGSIVARLRQLFLIVFISFLSYHHRILPLEMKITIKTLQQKMFQVSHVQVIPRISRSRRNPD